VWVVCVFLSVFVCVYVRVCLRAREGASVCVCMSVRELAGVLYARVSVLMCGCVRVCVCVCLCARVLCVCVYAKEKIWACVC